MGQLFNSREYEYADIKVAVFGATLSGCRGVSFKKTTEKEPVYGAGREPVSIQTGTTKYEGSLTVLQSDLDKLQAAAKTAGYSSLADVPHTQVNITVAYAEGSRLQTHQVLGVGFTEFEYAQKSGDKFQEVELPFIFLRLSSTY